MTRRSMILCLIIGMAFGGSFLARTAMPDPQAGRTGGHAESGSCDHAEYRRIISLVPSITEVLFALGLGDRVVGVTDFCDYPPQATTRTKIGGCYNPNFEAILSLRPDLVILMKDQAQAKKYLDLAGLNFLVVDHGDVSGILSSLSIVGQTCGVEGKAEEIAGDIRSRIECISNKTRGLGPSTVMVSLGLDAGSRIIENVYIAGKGGFYDEMISMAGGVNVYDGSISYPVLAAESILRLNPAVIIDIIPDLDTKSLDEKMTLEKWESLSGLDAVKNNRVHVFSDDYVGIPGPRFILILEHMARVIYPEARWE